jgi:hypothetical protein
MWDLIQSQGMASKDVAALTFKTIGYFKVNSGFCDFAAALYAAEKALFQGAHEGKLTAVLTARGMTPFLPTTAPGCASISTGAGIGDTSAAATTTQKKKGVLGCGVVAIGDVPVGSALLLLIFAVPLLFLYQPKPARQRLRRRVRSKRP